MSRAAERLPCQVCGRPLAVRRNGLAKPHKLRRGAESYCRGTGHRHARWPAGALLRHHAGDIWQVLEDCGGEHGDYFLRCIRGRERGRELVAHGEYMHRDGWQPARFTKAEIDSHLRAVKRRVRRAATSGEWIHVRWWNRHYEGTVDLVEREGFRVGGIRDGWPVDGGYCIWKGSVAVAADRKDLPNDTAWQCLWPKDEQ